MASERPYAINHLLRRALQSLSISDQRQLALFSVVSRNCNFECIRPAAVGFNNVVNLLHNADGLVQGDHDLLVVGDVVLRERAALPVLQPLVADLVAADVEVPDLLGDAAEADGAGINYATPRSAAALSGGSSSLDPKG